MRLDLYVYSALLAAGLAGAYWASKPTPEGSEDRVAVVSLDPKAVTEVHFKAKDLDVVATKRPGDGRYLVTYTKTETPPPPPPNPHKDPKAPPPPPPPAPKVTTEHFLAGEPMNDLLKSLNPLQADRILDHVDDKQLADYGLKDSDSSLVVKSDGNKDFVLSVGKRSYGSRERFVKETGGSGRVLLVEDQAFETLERAPARLYERRLVSFDFADAAKAELTSNSGTATVTKKLAHTQRGKGGELLWTDDSDSAKPNPTYDTFMDKLGRLRLSEYAAATDEQALKDVKPFLVLTFEKDGKVLDHLSFKKTPGDKPVYWATSDFLQTYGKIVTTRMEPIEKDIPSIMAPAAKS